MFIVLSSWWYLTTGRTNKKDPLRLCRCGSCDRLCWCRLRRLKLCSSPHPHGDPPHRHVHPHAHSVAPMHAGAASPRFGRWVEGVELDLHDGWIIALRRGLSTPECAQSSKFLGSPAARPPPGLPDLSSRPRMRTSVIRSPGPRMTWWTRWGREPSGGWGCLKAPRKVPPHRARAKQGQGVLAPRMMGLQATVIGLVSSLKPWPGPRRLATPRKFASAAS